MCKEPLRTQRIPATPAFDSERLFHNDLQHCNQIFSNPSENIWFLIINNVLLSYWVFSEWNCYQQDYFYCYNCRIIVIISLVRSLLGKTPFLSGHSRWMLLDFTYRTPIVTSPGADSSLTFCGRNRDTGTAKRGSCAEPTKCSVWMESGRGSRENAFRITPSHTAYNNWTFQWLFCWFFIQYSNYSV